MNKKAVLFHWIFFVMLGALIVFFAFFNQNVQSSERGVWHTQFLQQNYLAAEKDLLQKDIIITKIATEVARDVTWQGGFAATPECGKFKDINLWNAKGRWCLPGAAMEAATLASARVTATLPQEKYSGFLFSGTYLKAKGERKIITSDAGKYHYDSSFAVDISYSFAEFDQLKGEALRLVSLCAGKEELQKCVSSEKPTHWKGGSCDTQEDVAGPIVPFCISSPGNYNLYLNGRSVPVRYQLALEFGKAAEIAEEALQS